MKIIRYKSDNSTVASVGLTDGNSVWNIDHLNQNQPGSTRKVIELMIAEPGLINESTRGKTELHLGEVRLLAPIVDPGKLFCIGRNYADHASEMGSSVDEYPVVFCKFPSVIIGPGESVKLPVISQQVDYEAELVVVIGRGGSNIEQSDALEHIFGYTCGNDISARDWQKNGPGGQWLLGKSFDTFAPLGPWIETVDGIPDAGNLEIQLTLNGQVMQSSNTRHLIFNIPYLVSHLSKFCELHPGDLIFTGTPSGVGAARKPPVFLKPGDQMEVSIGQLGSLKNDISNN